MSADLTIISPLSWVQDAFKGYFDKTHMSDSSHSDGAFAEGADERASKPQTTSATSPVAENPLGYWTTAYDYGFEPARGIKDNTAVWITPDLLIANNTWRIRHEFKPLLFEAPASDWLARLPRKWTQRNVITVPVSEIRTWPELPKGLGERPWSQLTLGRVPEFRAARRNLKQLQDELHKAPDDSLITVNTHINGISEEWCVIVNGGKATASSGYCVHRSQDEDSHDILTVFDGARFHDSYRALAESIATRAAQVSHLDNASIIVGFRNVAENKIPPSSTAISRPLIIEADPVWCTTPYPFETAQEITAFLKAISDCRIVESDNDTFKKRSGQSVPETDIYVPDPWMIRHAEHRYDRF
ncbi:MAG: hypothetical protein J6575_00045 [Bifidobacterium sp.]|nr:hypothetical protein [Bifidobacterium sp.]